MSYFKWCSNTAMRKILDFLSCGQVSIGDLEMKEFLELLDASRLMCLNMYYEIEPHIKDYIETALFQHSASKFQNWKRKFRSTRIEGIVHGD